MGNLDIIIVSYQCMGTAGRKRSPFAYYYLEFFQRSCINGCVTYCKQTMSASAYLIICRMAFILF